MHTLWRIQHGRIIDPTCNRDEIGDIFIKDGKIINAMDCSSCGELTIDASGCWVVPGCIDMHAHLREPGEEYKEDIHSGARAAATGGFTALACMPDTSPVNDSGAVTEFILSRAKDAAARIYPIGSISKANRGEQLSEMGELKTAGAIAVSDAGNPLINSQLMRRALEYASDFNLPLLARCEETFLSSGVMNEGTVATRLGLKGIPTAAEAIMVYRNIALAECTGKKIHLTLVSTEQSVALIRAAKKRGIRVTAGTAPHYCILTDKDVSSYDTNMRVSPPLRSEEDRIALLEALADGTLDVLTSGHSPQSILEKECEFEHAANGMIALETAMPLSLSFVQEGLLTPHRLIQLFSSNPAKILGVAGGNLQSGTVADLTIIKPDAPFLLTENHLASKSRNTPFLNKQMVGSIQLTMLGGAIQYQNQTFPTPIDKEI